MQKILIIQTAYIGDVILATSLVDLTKRQFPNAQIDFLLRAGNESLLADHPNINKVFIWNKKQKYKSMFAILKEIRKQDYDLCLNIQRFMNSGIFTLLSKAKEKVIFNKNPLSFLIKNKVVHKIPHYKDDKALHEVQRNALLLKEVSNVDISDNPKDLPLSLFISDETQKKIKAITDKNNSEYLVFAPASVWFTKQFSKEQWMELKTNLSQYHIYFIGAPSDKDFIQKIIQEADHCTNLCGKLSLIESAALMKEAKRVFVNDSAPLHLASAVNAKTTALFCSTIPDFGYGPLATDSKVIEVQEKLDCRPCGLHGKKECPLGHFKCSKDISIDEILKTV